MRFLFWFLLLAAAAVAAALAVKLNSGGYALLVTPPYRIELSLNLLLFIAVQARRRKHPTLPAAPGRPPPRPG